MLYHNSMHRKEISDNLQENYEKKPKKRTKKQLLLQIFAIILVTVAGIGAGFYSGMLYLSSKIPKVDYGAYDADSLRANAQEILAANSGKSVSQLSAVDAFVIAQYNTENCPKYISETNSSLHHNFGSQSIYAYGQKFNGTYLFKEISTSSMKSIANKFLFDGTTILMYSGTPTSKTSAEWSNSYKTMTDEEYKAIYGMHRYEIVSYIVSEKTISESDTTATVAGTGKKLSNGNYQFKLSLDTKSSVVNYAKKIKAESNISGYPTFYQLDLVFEITPDLKFASITSIESYSFSYSGIAVTCSGSIKTDYDYNREPIEA